MADKSNDRGLSITGPFILIGLGIVLLLQQLDLLQWSLWEVAFRLWPLIIIAVGADILIARRSFLGAVASLLAVLALLVGGIYLMGTGPTRSVETLSSEAVSFQLDDANSGKIELSLDAGKMQVYGLPESSGNVIEGAIHKAPDEVVTSGHTYSGGKVIVFIRSKWPQSYIFNTDVDYTWDLGLSPRVPLEIDLSLGAGDIEADLTGLQVASVSIKIGAGHVTLKLPSGRNLDVTVNIGAGSADIYLPGEAPVKVRCTTAVGNCALPSGSGFWSQTYTSPEYDTSDYKIQIKANVAVGGVTVVR